MRTSGCNIAAHAYLDTDLERVWEIVTDQLPPLRTAGGEGARQAVRVSARVPSE
jgi:uncharacterized protein with HEPN domain